MFAQLHASVIGICRWEPNHHVETESGGCTWCRFFAYSTSPDAVFSYTVFSFCALLASLFGFKDCWITMVGDEAGALKGGENTKAVFTFTMKSIMSSNLIGH